MKPTVLVVDDKPNFLSLLTKILGKEFRVVCAKGTREAIESLHASLPDVVVCDLKMPDGDGLEVLRALRGSSSETPFVLMTAYASVPTAVQAMREGAYDYVTKPFDPDELKALVLRAVRESKSVRAAVDEALHPATPSAPSPPTRFGSLLGASAVMHEVGRLIDRVAPTDATVLIVGETGTGKELVARELHERSPRKGRRMVALNCAAVPRALVESELFGYVRGSFTGATTDRVGLIEDANGSTLLLDEVGELALPVQAKLTRVLEERAVRRLGDTRERRVDVRLVAATHRDLPEMVRQKTFREDLWYRLNVCVIRLPPLRERDDDVTLLAQHFLATRGPAAPVGFTPEALAILRAHSWPGNVRELRSTIERAAILEEGPLISAGSLPPEVQVARGFAGGAGRLLASMTYREAVEHARDEGTRQYLEAVLMLHHGNVTAAAQQAGVERESFHRLLRRHGLRAEAWRHEGADGDDPKADHDE